jgi:hypothetical protein
LPTAPDVRRQNARDMSLNPLADDLIIKTKMTTPKRMDTPDRK